MVGLSERQAQVLKYIQKSIDENGYPPTLREIGIHMGIRSTNGVNDHLRALERKGYLGREQTKSRALRPLLRPDGEPPPVAPQPREPMDLNRSLDALDVFALMSALSKEAVSMRDAAAVMRGAA